MPIAWHSSMASSHSRSARTCGSRMWSRPKQRTPQSQMISYIPRLMRHLLSYRLARHAHRCGVPGLGIVPGRIAPLIPIDLLRPAEDHRLEQDRRPLAMKAMVQTQEHRADFDLAGDLGVVDDAVR